MSDLGDGHGSLLTFDHNSHFELQSDDSPLTYRMLQVIHDEEGQAHLVEAGPNTPVSVPAAESPVGGSSAGAAAKVYAQTSGGQYFVMMSPNELTQSGVGQRSIVTRTAGDKASGVMGRGDDRRKATHKEVERRRRDKINTWITQLAQLVPDCANDLKLSESKCVVLAKACEYITSLQAANDSMASTYSEVSATTADLDDLRRQYEQLQTENHLLWVELRNHGIEPPGSHPALVLDD